MHREKINRETQTESENSRTRHKEKVRNMRTHARKRTRVVHGVWGKVHSRMPMECWFCKGGLVCEICEHRAAETSLDRGGTGPSLWNIALVRTSTRW